MFTRIGHLLFIILHLLSCLKQKQKLTNKFSIFKYSFEKLLHFQTLDHDMKKKEYEYIELTNQYRQYLELG